MIKIPNKVKNSQKYIFAIKVIEILRKKSHDAFFVGGAVRDLLLGLVPKEFDINTSATPDEIKNLFPVTKLVGQKFGVTLIVEGNMFIEVATFREESNYSDKRRPDTVLYTSDVIHDIKRRDFTINGLLYDPITESVIDNCDGLKDIEGKVLRTIGDPRERLSEDYLRILRGIRFVNHLSLSIDKDTESVMRLEVKNIKKISIERIRDEITSILSGNRPGQGLKLLDSFGILDEILPELTEMKGIQQPPDFHPEGDVFVHTCLALDMLSDDKEKSIELIYGTLLHDIGKPDTYTLTDRIRFNRHEYVGAIKAQRICKRLKFSKKQTELICSLVKEHMKFGNIKDMKLSTFKKFVSMDSFNEHLRLHKADCLASHGDLSLLEFTESKMIEIQSEPKLPKPLISGDDLLSLGLKPGPSFKEILSKVFDEQLEGNIKDKEQGMILVRKMLKIE